MEAGQGTENGNVGRIQGRCREAGWSYVVWQQARRGHHPNPYSGVRSCLMGTLSRDFPENLAATGKKTPVIPVTCPSLLRGDGKGGKEG